MNNQEPDHGSQAEGAADEVPSWPAMSVQTRFVLLVLLQEPEREMFGLEIAKQLGLYPGTVYGILRRLYQAGWVVRREESAEEKTRPRRPKRFYCLTTDGAILAREVLTRDLTPIFATMADRLGLTIPTESERDRC